jgi:hypothetical protein
MTGHADTGVKRESIPGRHSHRYTKGDDFSLLTSDEKKNIND